MLAWHFIIFLVKSIIFYVGCMSSKQNQYWARQLTYFDSQSLPTGVESFGNGRHFYRQNLSARPAVFNSVT
jgi:hypothetical protein